MSELTWKPLPLPQRAALPTLLASATFASSSYEVYLTDLTHIWTESLARRPLIMRALKENASIDPSDGDDNMASFLKCLRAAFSPSDPMHHLTRISLSPPFSGASKDGLTLTVTCELPRELAAEPLTWNIYLEKQPPSATTTRLVLPLMQAHRAQQEKISALVEVIRQKDTLISKVLDKLEATGTVLEHVFAIAPGKRKVTRQQAEGRVKGLAPFDRAAWEESVDKEGRARDGEEDDVSGLVKGVFGGGLEYSANTTYGEGLENWWERIGEVDFSAPAGAESDDDDETMGKRTVPSSAKDSQRSRSPPAPSPRKEKPKKAKSPTPDEPTASETESDEEPVRKAPTKALPTRRLGGIGGAARRPPPSPSPPPSSSQQPKKKKSPTPATEDDATASESETSPSKTRQAKKAATPADVDMTDDENKDEPPSPARPAPAKRMGLGRIGGIGGIGGKPRGRPADDDDEDTGSEDDDGFAKEAPKEEKKVEKRPVITKPVKKKRKF